MKKFLVLYMAPVEEMDKMMQESTPEQMKAGMNAWLTWAKKHKEIKDIGAPLGRNIRVTTGGTSDERNEVGGYSFVEAESQEDAANIFKDSPHFEIPGGHVDIMECVEMK